MVVATNQTLNEIHKELAPIQKPWPSSPCVSCNRTHGSKSIFSSPVGAAPSRCRAGALRVHRHGAAAAELLVRHVLRQGDCSSGALTSPCAAPACTGRTTRRTRSGRRRPPAAGSRGASTPSSPAQWPAGACSSPRTPRAAKARCPSWWPTWRARRQHPQGRRAHWAGRRVLGRRVHHLREGGVPRNSTVQNTVWHAGPLSGGEIATRSTAAPNLRSAQNLRARPGNLAAGGVYTRPRVHGNFFSHAWDGIESCWRCILLILQKKSYEWIGECFGNCRRRSRPEIFFIAEHTSTSKFYDWWSNSGPNTPKSVFPFKEQDELTKWRHILITRNHKMNIPS